jgi:hypothetical protein
MAAQAATHDSVRLGETYDRQNSPTSRERLAAKAPVTK